MHEEDDGIGWKHVDLFGGTHEVRRSRRLVVSFVSTVGNYEYGFFWYLYLDGNIQLEVKLTGIVSPMAIEPGTTPEFATVVAPGVAAREPPAPVQRPPRLRRRRLRSTRCTRSRARRCRAGPDNPWSNAFRVEGHAARVRARGAARHERGDLTRVEDREPRRHATGSASRPRTSSCRR